VVVTRESKEVPIGDLGSLFDVGGQRIRPAIIGQTNEAGRGEHEGKHALGLRNIGAKFGVERNSHETDFGNRAGSEGCGVRGHPSLDLRVIGMQSKSEREQRVDIEQANHSESAKAAWMAWRETGLWPGLSGT
jgi:hypothetical protein